MAQERADAFDFWDPQTLVGPELKPGDKVNILTVSADLPFAQARWRC